MKFQLPYLNNKQRITIFVFALLIVLLQVVLSILPNSFSGKDTVKYEIDETTQKNIDSLKAIALKKYEQQPFNPNYINDYKGFKLGMTTAEIDKLVAFRAQGKYVNSAAEFQQVTGVSNELLGKMAPYFKFPEWTQKKQTAVQNPQKEVFKKIDLNKASSQELVALKGIGDYYANVLIAEREKLNGFVHINQIDFIKGLRPETVKLLKQQVFVSRVKNINKINVNTASKEQLATIPYISTYVSREIVVLRSKQNEPLKMEDLRKINNFPLDKLEIIGLYLAF
ncbi:helix-hairpin-helix domain-containing protein [Flavobacterium sp. CBA20B-1]|uniref:ComEA family DNA-binding protein n=1 Tax=unclassified Flavobacterium TaxID=196869 RepID=UPI00222498B0|nr:MULTISPECIES: helix-hairpin-helix domain-containing protein [unclassified Flavobacterium]WCM43379.1 helix-hairpin-helix domain-containing protein [Flavobacterium sp. CBA20B-1]